MGEDFLDLSAGDNPNLRRLALVPSLRVGPRPVRRSVPPGAGPTMRRLILFRHARAKARAPAGDDLDRPLDEVGRAEAVLAGQWLAARGFAADLVLVSPSARTRETWDQVAPLLPKTRLVAAERLYDAAPEDILAAFETAGPDEAAVMVIGHNPGLQEVAVLLLSDHPASADDAETLAAGFPTAGVAVLDLGDPRGARLEALFNPGQPGGGFTESWDAGGGRTALSLIYKLASAEDWARARATGRFVGAAEDLADGFIHFSAAGEAEETARRHFAGRDDMVLLAVEASDLGPALRWEASRGGALFPHLHGVLETRLVRWARPAPLGPDGVPNLGDLAR